MSKVIKALVVVMIVLLTSVSFLACGVSRNPSKARDKLEKAEYSVVYTTDDTDAGRIALAVMAEGLVTFIVASNGNESITIWYFDDTESAKKYWDEHYEGKEVEDGYKAAKMGKVIYYGTEEAIEIA